LALSEIRFGGYSRRDGTVAFYTRVNALLAPSARVLDYCCGVGAHISAEDPFTGGLQRRRGKVAEFVGVDVDGSARDNLSQQHSFAAAGALRSLGFDAYVYQHRGESHTVGAGYLPGLVGEFIERYSPYMLWHELNACAHKRSIGRGSRSARGWCVGRSVDVPQRLSVHWDDTTPAEALRAEPTPRPRFRRRLSVARVEFRSPFPARDTRLGPLRATA
jgi:hypothetical protein